MEEHDFANYCLFISFLPQLIAGPITHHGEMLAQFNDRDSFRARIDNLSLGATVFLLGLFKKVVIADTLALKATPVFSLAADGTVPAFYDAWTGALTHTLQIYFDSLATATWPSAGAAVRHQPAGQLQQPVQGAQRHRLLVALAYDADALSPPTSTTPLCCVTRARMAAGKPQPRRGKMTLGTFLALVAYPTVFTMFISGVWHGAGWQFVVFGLHGFYRGRPWLARLEKHGWKLDSEVWWHQALAVLVTFQCVVVAMGLPRRRRAGRAGGPPACSV